MDQLGGKGWSQRSYRVAAPGESEPNRSSDRRDSHEVAKGKIIDRVDDAAAALADGDDEALDILNGVLDDYGEDDD